VLFSNSWTLFECYPVPSLSPKKENLAQSPSVESLRPVPPVELRIAHSVASSRFKPFCVSYPRGATVILRNK